MMSKKCDIKLANLAAALKKNLSRRKNRSKTVIKSYKTTILSLLAVLFLACCKHSTKFHGPILDQYNLSVLKPYTTKVEDVIKAIGIPTVTEGNKFVYLNGQLENTIFFKPKIIKLDYCILTFDNNRTLVNIKHEKTFNVSDLMYNNDSTQFAITKRSMWNQITENISRFSTHTQKRTQ